MKPILTQILLSFPASRVDRTALLRNRIRQHDLLELTPPAAITGDSSMLVCGENHLLPMGVEPRHSYACCAYLVSADGEKAVPVVGCRPWFHAPLPAQTPDHPVWEDLGGGLLEATHCIDTSSYDLSGAVAAARSWMACRHGEVSPGAGSVLLMDRDTSIHCAAVPSVPILHTAKADPLTLGPMTIYSLPVINSLRLSA